MGSHLSHTFVYNLNFVLSLIFCAPPLHVIFIPLLWCLATLVPSLFPLASFL